MNIHFGDELRTGVMAKLAAALVGLANRIAGGVLRCPRCRFYVAPPRSLLALRPQHEQSIQQALFDLEAVLIQHGISPQDRFHRAAEWLDERLSRS